MSSEPIGDISDVPGLGRVEWTGHRSVPSASGVQNDYRILEDAWLIDPGPRRYLNNPERDQLRAALGLF